MIIIFFPRRFFFSVFQFFRSKAEGELYALICHISRRPKKKKQKQLNRHLSGFVRATSICQTDRSHETDVGDTAAEMKLRAGLRCTEIIKRMIVSENLYNHGLLIIECPGIFFTIPDVQSTFNNIV